MGEQKQETDAPELLDSWIAAFRGPLIGLLASWGRDWRAAEELAQDVFAEAWVGRSRFSGSFEDPGAIGAWLRGIAFNLHSAAQRKAEWRPSLALDGQEPASEASQLDPRQAALAEGFSKLSAQYQAVLRMHYLEETSTREVAALLGMASKAVEGRLYQARKALRAEIDRAAEKERQEVRG